VSRLPRFADFPAASANQPRSRPRFTDWRSQFPAALLQSDSHAAFNVAPAIQGARPTCVALGQAASASPRVAPVLQRRALARRGGIAGSSNDQAAPTLGARSFRRARPTSIALVQMPVTCHRITVVGKWRPNDSFKGKPLRGFRHPSGSLGGLPLIQVLGPDGNSLPSLCPSTTRERSIATCVKIIPTPGPRSLRLGSANRPCLPQTPDSLLIAPIEPCKTRISMP
jgi:hypothetical protein